jgi:hypothetical protein
LGGSICCQRTLAGLTWDLPRSGIGRAKTSARPEALQHLFLNRAGFEPAHGNATQGSNPARVHAGSGHRPRRAEVFALPIPRKGAVLIRQKLYSCADSIRAKIALVKQESLSPGQFFDQARENFQIYLALVASGVSILLLILLEMKFFGS